MVQANTPIQPSPATGILGISVARQERILRYSSAATAAKMAGVDGTPIRHPQRFVDQIVRQRVANAHTEADWLACVAEMDADEATWASRIADRAPRALAKLPNNAPAAGAATRLLRRSDKLTPEQRAQLAECWEEAMLRDEERVQELMPSIVQPHLASLRFRALEAVRGLPYFGEFKRVAEDRSTAVYAAAAASFAGDRLPAPLRGILLGPWAAIVDDDPSELEAAWSEDADDLRSDFTTMDPSAWDDPLDSF